MGSELQPGDMIQIESGSIVPLDAVSPTADQQNILVRWSEPRSGYVTPDKQYNVYSPKELEAGLTGGPDQRLGPVPVLNNSPNVPQSFGSALKSRRAQSR